MFYITNYIAVFIPISVDSSADSSQYKKLFLENQFPIKPNFDCKEPGIERIADYVVFDETFDKIICLSEVKNKDDDIDECLRQNADQLRAYCLCNNKKIGRGMATNGERWIFTEYDKLLEFLRISKVYRIFEKIGVSKFLKFSADEIEFFQSLMGFIYESI